MSGYVIRRTDGKFWVSAGRWSEEFPDAFKFTNWKNAAQEAIDSTPSGGKSQVLADYGIEAERIIATFEGSILGEGGAS